MKIKESVVLTLLVTVDGLPVEDLEQVFYKGEEIDANVLNTHSNGFLDLEFEDGSIAYNVDPNIFE